jgi:multiple sugar transport system permease protein
MHTVTVGVGFFAGYYGTQWAEFMAAATLATLPVILVYVFMQRQIIQGITLTGMKS